MDTYVNGRRPFIILLAPSTVKIIDPKLCLKCKGRLWCGLSRCPVYERLNVLKEEVEVRREVNAPTPPFFLISWKNYPNVAAGPYLSLSEPELIADPQKAMKLSMAELMSVRASTVRPFQIRNVRSSVEDAALSIKPVEMSARLKSVPSASLSPDFFGPSSVAEKIEVEGNPKIPKKVDYFYESYDVRAEKAIQELEKFGVEYLVQLLSTGSLGVKNQRKLVPTRWAITAVDSILAKKHFETVRRSEQIDRVEVYHGKHWDNNFVIVLLPWEWAFEVMEMWSGGSAWGSGIVSDSEYGELKKDYARNVTGSYYAARLEVLKHLAERKKQAACLVLREIGPEYYFPVGVWHVRETVKMALKGKPERFDSWKDARERVGQMLKSTGWENKSKIIKAVTAQTRLSAWF